MKDNFLESDMIKIGSAAKDASRIVSQLDTKIKNDMLCCAAEILIKNKDLILSANEKDTLNSVTIYSLD